MPAPSRPWSLPDLTDLEYARIRALIYQEVGIHLGEHKQALVIGRLSPRLRALGIASFRAYYQRVLEDETERTILIDRITTNETHFFREPHQFAFLRAQVFSVWEEEAARGERPRVLRVWSAACSTGEEPHTLGMLLLERFPPATGWQIEVLGTDISTRVLEKASAGVWPIKRAEEIDRRYLERYMLRGVGVYEGTMKARDELREIVSFERHNLIRTPLQPTGNFDAIFCRNVLIYFDRATRERVLRALLTRLSPGGFLFLGHAESVNGMDGLARCAVPAIYRRDADPRSPR